MLVTQFQFQQEIGEASDDTARKYYDETPNKDRTDAGVTTVMRAAARLKHQSFKGQFFKYLSIANPKFGDRFLEEVGFPLMTLLKDLFVQELPYIYIHGLIVDHKALEQQREARDVSREARAHCNGLCSS